jgi:arylsulfatase A
MFRPPLLLLAALLLFLGLPVPLAAAPPNVIVILVDDLGWTDLGCYGSRFHRTPHLDQLAREGVRFTDAYSACTVCSPTRAALLTGQHPARLHVTDWIPGDGRPKGKLRSPEWNRRLDPAQPTLARQLKTAGYATAVIGKWHLGGTNSTPAQFGFDVNRGGDHRGQPPRYVSPYGLPELPDGPAGEFLTDRESQEAVAFIEANRARPFFLYLPHYAVHQPIAGKPEVVAKYQAAAQAHEGQRNAEYAALLESVDDSVGRIRASLEALKLATNTVIVFTSDNGGLVRGGPRAPTSNWPLRSGKGDCYEGGVRVPLIVHAPGITKPGITSSTPVQTVDLYPTILELAGVTDVDGHERDGVSWVPLLKGAGGPARSLYWHYPHYHSGGATPYGALRSGDWKLVEFFENGHLELFNLASDIGETQDLANAYPEKANALAKELGEWRKRVGAQMPVRNPDAEPVVLRPQPDGTLILPAHEVTTHGKNLQYEPPAHKNTVGYWTLPSDWASWEVELARPGRYEVELLQGCGTGSGGSEVEVSLGEARFQFVVVETGGFQKFLPRKVGILKVPQAGRATFALKPQKKPGAAVMDVRQVTLRPLAD